MHIHTVNICGPTSGPYWMTAHFFMIKFKKKMVVARNGFGATKWCISIVLKRRIYILAKPESILQEIHSCAAFTSRFSSTNFSSFSMLGIGIHNCYVLSSATDVMNEIHTLFIGWQSSNCTHQCLNHVLFSQSYFKKLQSEVMLIAI